MGGGGGIKIGGGFKTNMPKFTVGRNHVLNKPFGVQGKNSLLSKPLGTGEGSVAKGLEGLFSGGGDKSIKSLSTGDIMRFLKAGAEEGETLVGGTKKEMGEGRADVRKRLKDTLEGNSAGANALKQDQAQAQRDLKAQQMLAGGGQMNVGQQQALKRQASRDLAKFRSDETRQALADLSREFRGAGSDIMRSEGQYGSVLVGAQPPATVKPSSGILTNFFGNFF